MNIQNKLLVCTTLACLALAGTVFGQSTTGRISGTVTAQEDGSALPGAIIEAVHEPTGTRYNTVTDDIGRFRLLNVRVGGPYTVSAAIDGFRTAEASEVSVKLGESAYVTFELQLETITETVQVVAEASPLINPGRTGAASSVSTEDIEALPTVQRTLYDFARTNPLFTTVADDTTDTDSLSVAGANNRYNNITIDGSVNNDLFGLADTGTPGGQSGTTPISLDAIQELELVIADFDVRNGGFSGGAINAVTRSGTNKLKGSAFFFTRDKDFFGDGPDVLGEFGDFEEDQFGFRLGGPISQDKVFFFVNADLEDRSDPSGWSLDGSSGQTFAGANLVEEATVFRNFLIDNFGFDPGGLEENIRDDPSDKYFARLDFNLDDSHNLTVRHNFVDAARDINRPNSFTYEFPSETYDFQTETNSSVAQLNSVFGSNAFNEARVALQSIRDSRAGRDGLQFPWIEIEDVNGSASGRNEFEAGTEPFSTRNALDTDILEIHNDFTWLKGNHTITIGTHNELFSFDNLFIQNAFGSFEFASLETFLTGVAREFEFTVVNPGQPERQTFDVNQLGFYIGDQFIAGNNLTLNFGVRFDIPFFPDEPSANPDVPRIYADIADFYASHPFDVSADDLRTESIPDGEVLFQPRFGFNYDMSGNGTSQLRGGAGIFAGRTPYVWISNQYARTGIEQSFIVCNNVQFSLDPVALANECSPLDERTGGEFNLIDPDFEFPQNLRYNLAYDRQLPWWGLVASAELVFTDVLEGIDYKNVNIRPVGTTFDGRTSYEQIDRDVDGAFYITNTDDGESTTFSVKIERPMRRGVAGFVSYANTDSETVNEGTSSRAVSNFNFNEALDPNNAGVSRSDFEVEHRFNASLSYMFNRDTRHATNVSFFYNLQSGRPFGWNMGSDFFTFSFGESFNGDGTDGNDPAWIPATADDVVITGGGTWEQLDSFLRANPVLDAARGGIVARNSDEAPWNHTFDLHVDQDIPIGRGKLELTFDILNLLNLIDEDSGTLRFVQFNAVELFELEGVCGTQFSRSACGPGDDGKPVISLNNVTQGTSPALQIHTTRSRWRARFGIRYTF